MSRLNCKHRVAWVRPILAERGVKTEALLSYIVRASLNGSSFVRVPSSEEPL
jgi:hypothetical protein